MANCGGSAFLDQELFEIDIYYGFEEEADCSWNLEYQIDILSYGDDLLPGDYTLFAQTESVTIDLTELAD